MIHLVFVIVNHSVFVIINSEIVMVHLVFVIVYLVFVIFKVTKLSHIKGFRRQKTYKYLKHLKQIMFVKQSKQRMMLTFLFNNLFLLIFLSLKQNLSEHNFNILINPLRNCYSKQPNKRFSKYNMTRNL